MRFWPWFKTVHFIYKPSKLSEKTANMCTRFPRRTTSRAGSIKWPSWRLRFITGRAVSVCRAFVAFYGAEFLCRFVNMYGTPQPSSTTVDTPFYAVIVYPKIRYLQQLHRGEITWCCLFDVSFGSADAHLMRSRGKCIYPGVQMGWVRPYLRTKLGRRQNLYFKHQIEIIHKSIPRL